MDREVIVYGAGLMGKAAIKILKNFGVNVVQVVDRNPQLSGKCINDITIVLPEDLDKKTKDEGRFVIAMSTRPYYEIRDYLLSIGVNYVYPVGDYIQEIDSKIEWANIWSIEQNKYELLQKDSIDFFCDTKSILDYTIALEWFFSRNEKKWIDESFSIDKNKYFPDFIINKITNRGVMVDTSIMNGEYAEKFLKIIPDGLVYSFMLHPNMVKKNEIKTYNNIKIENKELYSYSGKLSCVRRGIMEPFILDKEYSFDVTTIDEYFEEIDYSFLRIYSMSRVKNIIEGAKKTIDKYRPIIAVNIGHYEDDFSEVPFILREYCQDYLFYFRIHSFQGNDCILYGIPK